MTARFASVLSLVFGAAVCAAQPADDLADFRTLDKAVKSEIAPAGRPRRPVFVGLQCVADAKTGKPRVESVVAHSPAAVAHIEPGDLVVAFNGIALSGVDDLRRRVLSADRRQRLALTVVRGEYTLDKVLVEPSLPPPETGDPRTMVRVGALFVKFPDGSLGVSLVEAGSAAENAGLRVSDRIISLDGKPVETVARFLLDLYRREAGSPAALTVKRDDRTVAIRLTMPGSAARNPALPPAEPVRRFRLAIAGIEFEDVRANPDWKAEHWRRLFFSQGEYTGRSPTGDPVFGSVRDWYAEQSAGAFALEGEYIGLFRLPRPKEEFARRHWADADFAELAAALVVESSKRKVADEFDGIAFVVAGSLVREAGSALWPRKGRTRSGGRDLPYVILAEDGRTFPTIAVAVHEIGHLLGLPDQYGGTGGTENLGLWCVMALGHKGLDGARGARPNHLCAWCKRNLGWLKPVVIDPAVPQKLLLKPVEGSATECVLVLMQPDAGEYLLLENRAAVGFDADLPGTGLLIWRVTDWNRVELEPAHGLRGNQVSLRSPARVPFPQSDSAAFTPNTSPDSRARTAGGRDVHLVDIRKRPAGEITFLIGYEFF